MLRLLPLSLLALLIVPAYATDLPAQISGDRTLSLAESPYFLQTSTSIDAGVTVTIEPGVEIIATGDVRLFVNGTLSGGSDAAPIVFRFTDAGARGAWEGLYVAPTGHLRLTNATIRNGVYGVMTPGGEVSLIGCRISLISTDALFAWGGSVLNCSGCEFRDSSGRGLYVEGYQASGSVSSCLFADNGGYPVQVKATLLEMLGGGNSFTNNGRQCVGVSCSLADDITDSDTWPLLPVPIELGAGGGDPILTIASGAQLTIAAGNTIYARQVACRGRLEVAGSAALPVVFTVPPENRVPGAWEGLLFYSGSTGALSHVTVAYAGTGLTADGAILSLQNSLLENCQYDGARLTGASVLAIADTTFRNNGRCGLRLEGPGTLGSVANCQFLACGSYPLWSLAANLRCVQGGHVYVGNAVQMVGVSCGGTPDLASGNHVWVPQSIPLDCSVAGTDAVLNIASGASLTIPGGQTLYLGGLDVYGQLNVTGSRANPCLFLPVGGAATPGAWNGLRFIGGSGSLQGAVARYGANGLSVSNASPVVRECVFCDSQYDGLSCTGTAAPVVTRTGFVGNGRHGVAITGTARPNLGDVTNASLDDQGENSLQGNGGFEVYNDTTNNIRAQNNTWASTAANAIAARIHDGNDQPGRGSVIFQPIQSVTSGDAPVLSWIGAAGYTDDGVAPDVATPGAEAEFRVKYTDPQGEAPAFVRVHVLQGGTPVDGSPFAMTRRGPASYTTGAVFVQSLLLAAGRNYRYWFAAAGAAGASATGAPTLPQSGPTVNTAPTLTYSTEAGYGNDGVAPDTGAVAMFFGFRCVYADADNDEPSAVRCDIWCGGVALAGSPFDMTARSDASCLGGRVYEYACALTTAGSYSYRFEASDGVSAAVGPAVQVKAGPTVSAVGPLVAGLTVQQLRMDLVEVQWRQSVPGEVSIDILNLAGRTVARVCRNVHYEPGDVSAQWSRRLPSSAPAPAGSYVLVLEAIATDGTRWRAMAPLRLR